MKDRVITMAEFKGDIKGKPDVDIRKAKIADELAYAKATIDIQVELQFYVATLIKAKYDALIRVGFNEQVALMLCR